MLLIETCVSLLRCVMADVVSTRGEPCVWPGWYGLLRRLTRDPPKYKTKYKPLRTIKCSQIRRKFRFLQHFLNKLFHDELNYLLYAPACPMENYTIFSDIFFPFGVGDSTVPREDDKYYEVDLSPISFPVFGGSVSSLFVSVLKIKLNYLESDCGKCINPKSFNAESYLALFKNNFNKHCKMAVPFKNSMPSMESYTWSTYGWGC